MQNADSRSTGDCDSDPGDLTIASARSILAAHRHDSWLPCLQRLAALAYLREIDE